MTMSRIPEITKREVIHEDQRHHYDSIVASRKRIGAPYGNLLHCPDLAARTAHLVGYSLFTSDFPLKEKEMVICTVAREMDCVYEWAAHSGDALNAGVSAETVAAIRDRSDPDVLSEEEAPFVKYVQELMRPPHSVTEPTFRKLRNRLGDQRLAELTGIVGSYVGLACSLNAFEIKAPEGMPGLPVG